MRKSVLLVCIAILAAFGAGFFLGRTHSSGITSRSEAGPGARPGQDAHAPSTAPTRDFASEDSIAAGTVNADGPGRTSMMPAPEDANRLGPPPPRPASPTENRLLGKRGLRSEDHDNVLMNPHFGQVIDALSREATADTMEMTRLYRERLASNLKTDPRFQLARMTCGAHLCVVTALGPVDQEQTLSELMMAESKGPRWYAVMPASLPAQGNATTAEYHLMFTIDPKHNSFEVGPQP